MCGMSHPNAAHGTHGKRCDACKNDLTPCNAAKVTTDCFGSVGTRRNSFDLQSGKPVHKPLCFDTIHSDNTNGVGAIVAMDA